MLSRTFIISSQNVLTRCLTIVSTNAQRTAVQAATNEKKLEYYKNLNTKNVDDTAVFPGWDEARPFETIPGPKPLPLIGNLWRVIPKVGDFHGKGPKQLMEMELPCPNERSPRVVADKYLRNGLRRHPQGETEDVLTLTRDPAGNQTSFIDAPRGSPLHTTCSTLFTMYILQLYRHEGTWPIHRGLPSIDYYRKVLRKDMFQNVGGVFSTQGEEWYKLRSVINPILMKPKNVLNYVDKMNLVADQFVDNMTYFASKNKNGEMPENFLKEIYKWSLESVSLVTLDRQLGCLEKNLSPDSEPAKLIKYGNEMMQLMYELDMLPSVWKFVSTPTWRRYVEVMDFLENTCFHYINDVKSKIEEGLSESEEHSMLQQLLVKDPKVAVVTALDMLIAGIDTTGRILGAALYFLAKFPEKQAALREEAIQLLPSKDTPITQDDVLAKAHYLKATIKEVTRISPIGMGTQRKAVKNIVLGGYQIPKETNIITTTNLIASNQDKYFTRAGEFLPERWLRTTTGELSFKNSHQFLSLPFGFGPRSCVGKRIANVELEVALLKIVRNFELSWPHEDMVFGGNLLYGIMSPLKIRISPIE